jgi:hypothetical protein
MARFVRARKLLDRYRRGLLITDVDFFLDEDPGRRIERLGDEPVIFEEAGIKRAFPWLRIRAGLVYLPANRAGRRFAALLGKTLLSAFNPAGRNWAIDQNALSGCAEYLRARGENFRTARELELETLFAVPYELKDQLNRP